MLQRSTILIIIAVVIVIGAWFWGFYLPRFFPGGLKDSGVFGDGFGSINALFSGLGFAGLVYTIILQISAGKDQAAQHKFDVSLKLVDDVKNDLKLTPFTSKIGIEAIIAFYKLIEKDPRNAVERGQDFLIYLFSAVNQCNITLDYAYHNIKDEVQTDLIKNKLILVFTSHFLYLYSIIQKISIDDDNAYNDLKQELELFKRKLLPDFIVDSEESES
jgi:hypothetical protein